jgi:CxxC-x17-CxxC domain-containing protein
MARFEKSGRGSPRGGRESRGRPSRGNSRGRRSFDDEPSFEDRPRRSFGGGRGGDRRGGDRGGRPEMHDVVCDKCGKECQVPFRPTSSKPVFCSECFEQNESRGGSSRGGSRGGPSSADLDIINEKLNKIMKALKIEDKPKKGKKSEEYEADEEDSAEDDE